MKNFRKIKDSLYQKYMPYIKNKKGAVEIINVVVMILILLMLFVFFIDIMIFTRTYLGMSNFTDGITRTIAIQGGVSNTTPARFPGGAEMYFDNNEIRTNITNASANYNLDPNTISMFVQHKNYTPAINRFSRVLNNDNTFRPSSASTEVSGELYIPYGQHIYGYLRYEYRWHLFNITTDVTVKKSFLSEYKRAANDGNNSDWEEM